VRHIREHKYGGGQGRIFDGRGRMMQEVRENCIMERPVVCGTYSSSDIIIIGLTCSIHGKDTHLYRVVIIQDLLLVPF
jgi:hypothetical protein